MKSKYKLDEWKALLVAPLVGAWIEMYKASIVHLWRQVAPLVGAWIEILSEAYEHAVEKSLPSWERGLKSLPADVKDPFWSRSPRGSVD